MAKTLLEGVNEVLKRVRVIAGDAGELATLTDSGRQTFIDTAVQVINEGNDELYTASELPKPLSQAESTITLATGTRAYSLAAGVVRLIWPLIDKTNTQFIDEYPGGYNQILLADPEQDDTGLPHFATISPVDGKLYCDRAASSENNGNIYTYQYLKEIELTLAADTVPYDDIVFRAMVPAWVQLWKREQRNEFDGDLFTASIGRASRLLTRIPPRASWLPR